MTYKPTKEELEELGFEISIASNWFFVWKYYIINDSWIDSDDNIIYQKITIDYYEWKEGWTMCSWDYSNSWYLSFWDNFRLSVSCYEDIATLIKLFSNKYTI